MQSGADRQLGIDAPCDRNAREALVRVGVVAYERFVADPIVGRESASRRKESCAFGSRHLDAVAWAGGGGLSRRASRSRFTGSERVG
jgi:hypothetical protein